VPPGRPTVRVKGSTRPFSRSDNNLLFLALLADDGRHEKGAAALSKEGRSVMSDETRGPASAPLPLPENPNLDWLRKQAKRRLDDLRATAPDTQLAAAQFDVAQQYGFPSWRALKAHVDALTIEGQLFDAARSGDVGRLRALLDEHPERLSAWSKPYEWSLLHAAAEKGHLAALELLLTRGLDVNTREKGDNTCAMHWAAAAGHVDVVQRLADAGGDVVGHGDDHDLEVIGWATCWYGCDDERHRQVAELLVSRGARHHVFSAVAMNLADEVRRIVANDPSALNRRMSRNEDHQLPLHFAVRMNRPEMVALLLELGADPLATDGSGYPAAMYATSPEIDRAVMTTIRAMTSAELLSAERGHRRPRDTAMDLLAVLSLGDWQIADRLARENPRLVESAVSNGADLNARWPHWDAEVTPLHLAAHQGQAAVARVLLERGADTTIRDSKHDSDPLGWAEFFEHREIVEMMKARR
jgi:ankyrin repeat protein